MTKISVVLGFLLALSPLTAIGAGLTSDISAYLTASDVKERYTACLVLGELPLSSEIESRIRNKYKVQSKNLDRLCLAFVLAKRTQERSYQNEFIQLYPAGKAQAIIWQRHSETGYPFGLFSPLNSYLADLAATDDTALAKLAAGLPYADGANAENLVDRLAVLYRKNPNRVNRALRSASADSYMELIRITAIQREKGNK